ncbi:signal peptidase II [Psychromicrobium silvestre]|uniref:Lipoprotein signal peptidase n=1 Tax=Psychromicrobium silvestre TaxID=1645614 RepID=A0A7Y9S3P6_9MICC|nr:signal peptidase II [Psychromicrobium silvestre]NYE93978.1 signal peptidase II [Psychromicrobium silvestre]
MTETPSVPETPDSPEAPAAPARSRGSLLAWLVGFAVLAYGLDQLTKFWVSTTMTIGQITEVLPPVLRWYYITNSGAAFSLGEGYAWVFSIVMAAVSLAIIWQARRLGSAWWAVALGMVLGGALGNLTDRLFRPPSFGMGHVVDFISVPNFAIFNLADSAVVGGVILICVLTLLGVPFRGGPRKSSGQEPDAKQE